MKKHLLRQYLSSIGEMKDVKKSVPTKPRSQRVQQQQLQQQQQEQLQQQQPLEPPPLPPQQQQNNNKRIRGDRDGGGEMRPTFDFFTAPPAHAKRSHPVYGFPGPVPPPPPPFGFQGFMPMGYGGWGCPSPGYAPPPLTSVSDSSR